MASAGGKGSGKGPSASGKAAGGRSGASRQSVAAARRSGPGNNRTQLIIGGIALVVIIGIVVFGVVLNRQQTATQAEGYGASTQSVATASADGGVTVTKPGGTPKATIDIYEDAMCPGCAELERQYGQQINQELDNGNLTVNYRMVDFLNPLSASGDYSSRAAGALLCVAQESGSQPGVYMAFHSALFASENQPEENGSTDPSNQQLADLATSVGASEASATCIAQGQQTAAAATAATAFVATLNEVTGGRAQTPTVVKDGTPVALTTDWLTNLVS
ncbi:MAG TPA: thioredoxin domain-containing protein [Nakamurella sp.]